MKSRGLLSRIGSLFRPARRSEDRPGWWRPLMEFGGTVRAGVPVNESTALNVSAVYACVRNISEDVAKLPLHLYSMDDVGNKSRARSHPLYRVLHDAPNPEMSSVDFRQCLTGHMLTWGNGYAEIEWSNNNKLMSLWPIHPRRVSVKRDDSGAMYYEVRPVDGVGRTKQIRPKSMFHVKNFGPDGCVGYSPIKIAAESIGASLATDRFASSFFGNNAWPGFALEHPGTLEEEARRALRSSFEERHQGADNAFRPILLQDGMKLSRFSVPPDEAQFLETRQFGVEEICRWYRMPPHKVQQLLRAHYNNIEHQAIEYVTDTLLPWLVRWENEISRKLIPDASELFAEHSIEGMLRGDSESRAKFYNQMFQIGAFSTNDILRLENRNSIGPDGDRRFVMTNLTPLDAAANTMPAGDAPNGDTDENDPESPDAAPPAETDDDNPTRNLPPDVLRSVADSFSVALADTVKRMLAKETTAITAAAKREADINAWADSYYTKHAGVFEGAVLPIISGMARAVSVVSGKRVDGDAVIGVMKSAATAYLTESRARMFDCANWGETRADKFAASVVDDIAGLFGVPTDGK